MYDKGTQGCYVYFYYRLKNYSQKGLNFTPLQFSILDNSKISNLELHI
jgi:hypothetical protein